MLAKKTIIFLLHLEKLCSNSWSHSFPLFFCVSWPKQRQWKWTFTFFLSFFLSEVSALTIKPAVFPFPHTFHDFNFTAASEHFTPALLCHLLLVEVLCSFEFYLHISCWVSASTASVLAEQLLPEVNQSSPTLGVEEDFSLCFTRTVFSETWSTTNRACFAPAAYCKSICFFFLGTWVFF